MTELPDIATTPIGFIELVLGLPLYDWQQEAVYRLEFADYGKPIIMDTILAPNEAGKSSRIVAGKACYWLAMKNGKVGITTKDQKQLNEQIIPAIEAQVHKFEGWHSVKSPYYKLTTPKGGVLIAFTTDDANRVEGLHGEPGHPLLWEVDEGKSVEEKIYEGIDRCGYQALSYTSSGGLKQGTFWKSHTQLKDKFHCVTAGLKDCPHISPDKVQRIIEKYGENHPFTRSCVYGEFMDQDDEDSFIFSHASVTHALENPPRHKSGLRVGFVDFAEGSAEHVLAARDGNRTQIHTAFREANKHAACSRLIRAFNQAGFKEDDLWGDAADKESLDILASMGWNIHRKNFGSPAGNSEVYVSWGAEAWIEAASGVSTGELIVPPDDILIAQLTSRKRTITGRGKLGVEEKYDMRKRGVESPDRADAWCGANRVYSLEQVEKQPWQRPDGWATKAMSDDPERESVLVEMGGGW